MVWVVATLYKFTTLTDFRAMHQPLLSLMKQYGIKGTILLAQEGINGTVCGTPAHIKKLKAWFDQDSRFEGLEYKEDFSENQTFYRTKVKLKKEIVTMGIEQIDPAIDNGTYVNPEDWNQLISDPDVTVLDARNDYEIKIGSFEGAISPNTNNFREFPDFVNKKMDVKQHKKVAMFCTGGIRCEKATAYLKSQGFESVYHLKGGILKYLATVPQSKSLWNGECFVFDQRVAVNHDLTKGQYNQCYACRVPINTEDQQSDLYQKGISCPYCHHKLEEKQLKRFKEREKQIDLALKKGKTHIGDQE